MKNAKVDVMELFRLWNAGVETQDICDRLSIGRYKLFTLAEKYGLPRRPRNQDGVAPRRVDDPTPEQIHERCLAVQATWSESERENRLVGFRRGRVEVGRFRYSYLDCSYRQMS